MKQIFELMGLSQDDVDSAVIHFTRSFGQLLGSSGSQQQKCSRDGRTLYVLATTSRTGTTYLGSVLEALGIGYPREYLNMSTATLAEPGMQFSTYMENLFSQNTAENGVFGIKCGIYDLLAPLEYDAWPYGFDNWHWIYIDRHDILQQSISLVIAEQTGSWNTLMHRSGNVNLDIKTIIDRMHVNLQDKKRWSIFFSTMNIEPCRIYYEEIENDVLSCAGRIRLYIGLPQNSIQFKRALPIKKQAQPLNSEWRRAVQEILLKELTRA
jgi:LPS sulfotransferase NodH